MNDTLLAPLVIVGRKIETLRKRKKRERIQVSAPTGPLVDTADGLGLSPKDYNGFTTHRVS